MENWNIRIVGRDKILKIESKVDGSRMKIRMIDTSGGHYAIVLETRRKFDSNVLYLEDENQDVPVLFLEDKEGDLCSFKAVRKVHEINRHKSKGQMIATYRNASWMSPEMVSVIELVVNNCRVCQKFQKSIA